MAAWSTLPGSAGAGDLSKARIEEPQNNVESSCVQKRFYTCESHGIIKRKHTYAPGCKKFIEGATVEQMEKVAKGRRHGRSNLMRQLRKEQDGG